MGTLILLTIESVIYLSTNAQQLGISCNEKQCPGVYQYILWLYLIKMGIKAMGKMLLTKLRERTVFTRGRRVCTRGMHACLGVVQV